MLIGVIAEELLLPLIASTGRFVDGPFDGLFGPDTFYRPRLSVVGFVMPGLVDETDVLFGKENLYRTYVTQDYLGIFPDLFDDTVPEIFYSPTRSAVPVLAPAVWLDYDFIWAPTIPFNPPLAPQIRYVDPDIFFAPELRQSISPNLVSDNDIIRAQVIRRDGDAFVLLLEVFNDTDVIFGPSPSRAMLPGLVIDSDIFYAGAQTASLLPAAFNPGDTFFASFILSQLLPSQIADVDQFIGPAVRTPGRFELFVDDDFFFVSGVQFAPLRPSLLVDADTFPTEVIASNPALWPFAPADEFDVDDTFYVPNVIIFQALAPYLWPDVDILLGTLSIILGQGLAPGVVTDADVLFAPNMPPVLSPALFNDSDVFYTTIILNFTQPLAPSWILETDTFFVPSIAALAGFDGAISIDGPIMPSALQPTVILVES